MNENRFASLVIQLSQQVGSFQRMLGTIRRRGFTIDSLMATRNATTRDYRVEIRLAGTRSFDTLAKHLANHADIASVSVLASPEVKQFSRKNQAMSSVVS